MPPTYFPLRWESTGDQWWFASPIDWAAANGHYDLVRELLHLDTNLLIKLSSLRRIRRLESVWDDEEQFDDVAKCRSQVAQKLLQECETKKGHNSLIRAGYGGWLLYTAASAGDVIFVKKLLDKDPLLVFGEGEYGVTDIFYAAARSKNSEVFRLVLDHAILRTYSGSTDGENEEVSSAFRREMVNRAVHAAARRRECGDAQGSTVLHTASGRGQVEVVKNLLSSFDIINTTDNQGNTALIVAAYRGHLDVVKVLISESPSCPSLTNNYGDTFLHMAVAGFRTPGFRRLDRQIELMKQLIDGKVVNIEDIINVTNSDGRTALHMAIIENIQSDIVEFLMSVRYINLNIRDSDGNTPLDLLKQRPKSASSEILIKRLISAWRNVQLSRSNYSKCSCFPSEDAGDWRQSRNFFQNPGYRNIFVFWSWECI
ncbi:Ankyrin repeat family protein [Forsythia ovata]|uniref:Ankyrin repeat family protein n=1 Tax=Forsythia ovata TaxID=205694 RepID=A0ABD1TCQ9_9LAMI